MITLAAAAALALAGGPVVAGVGIQAGPVCPAATVAQGGTYTLPPVQVADTGSGDVAISVAVIRMTDRRSVLHGLPVPGSWVQFTYPRGWFGLVPGSSVHVSPFHVALVPATLAIPASAATGPDVAWMEPYPAGSAVAGHANLGGTGLAPFEFTVTPAGAAPWHAVCVTPGVKQASPPPAAHLTARTAAHDQAAKGHLIPAKLRKYVPDAILVALALGALMFLRRTGWL